MAFQTTNRIEEREVDIGVIWEMTVLQDGMAAAEAPYKALAEGAV